MLFSTKVSDIRLALTSRMSDVYSIWQAYIERLPSSFKQLSEEKIISPYANDTYIYEHWQEMCQKIVLLFFVRSLGNSAHTIVLMEEVSSMIEIMHFNLRNVPRERDYSELCITLFETNLALQDSLKGDELNDVNMYYTTSINLLVLLRTILGNIPIKGYDNVAVIGNYAIIEEYWRIPFLTDKSNSVMSMLFQFERSK